MILHLQSAWSLNSGCCRSGCAPWPGQGCQLRGAPQQDMPWGHLQADGTAFQAFLPHILGGRAIVVSQINHGRPGQRGRVGPHLQRQTPPEEVQWKAGRGQAQPEPL